MCNYCNEKEEKNMIIGKCIRTSEFKKTAGYEKYSKDKYPLLELSIYKGTEDEEAALLIENNFGMRYININYCPFCGRKLIG